MKCRSFFSQNFNTDAFNLSIARRLCTSSKQAYDTPDQIHARGHLCVIEPKYDLQAVIELHDDVTIVAYRGTRSLLNWKVDITAIPNKLGIHTGFYEADESLNIRILETLPRFPVSKPLLLTGHSLGGALALEGAIRYKPALVYTFGEPRGLTWHYIADSLHMLQSINHWRIVDREDIVPHVPGLLGGWRHTGQLGLISSFGEFEINPSIRRQVRSHVYGISADLCRIFQGELPQWVIVKEHSIDRYDVALRNLAYRRGELFKLGDGSVQPRF